MEPTTQGETVETKLPQLPRAWDLFKSALSFYKQHWSFVLTLFTVPFILTAAGGILTVVGGPIQISAITSQSLAYHITGILLTIAGGVFSYIATIGFIHFLSEKSAPVPTSVKESYKIGARLFFPFIWVGILTGLAVYGGFILFIVPGIILSLYLSFVLYVFVDEKKRGLDALTQSWNYTKGYAPNIFLKSLFYGVMCLPLFIVFVVIIALLGVTVKVGVQANGPIGVQIFFQLVEQALIVPLGLIYLYSIYEKVKQNKLAQGLAAAPEELEKKRRTKLIALSIFAPFVIIVGIGSAIVLTSLNVAREKAKEAAAAVESKTLPLIPYENTELGITVEYPSNWVPSATEEGQGKVVSFMSVTEDKTLTDFVNVIYVPLAPAEKNATLKTAEDNILATIAGNPNLTILEKSDTTLAGLPAFSITVEEAFLSPQTGAKAFTIVEKDVYVIKKGALYGLTLVYNKAKSPALVTATNTLFDRMLASYTIK